MSELPKGWAEVPMSDVASWGSGGTPSRSNSEYYGGVIPWIKTGELGVRYVSDTEEKITELGLKNSSAKLFEKGSVAIAMYGATIGKTSILAIDATTNQACGVGKPVEGITTSEYLYHYLSSQKEAFIEAGKGGAQPNISQTVIKDWPIPLAPLPEQKRIADKLDATLARVDACRKRLAHVTPLLKRFRQSVLAAATSGQLTADWRKQKGYGHVDNDDKELQENTRTIQLSEASPDSANPSPNVTGSYDLRAEIEHHRKKYWEENFAKKKYIPSAAIARHQWTSVPIGWMVLSLDTVATIKHGYAFQSKDFGNVGPIVLTPGNFTADDALDFKNKRVIRMAGDFDKCWVLPNGSLLVVMTDLSDKKLILGKTVELQSSECVLHNQRIGLIELTTGYITKKYLRLAMLRPDFKKYVDDTATGTLIQHTSPSRLLEGMIPLPSVSEQTEIVSRVETLFDFANRLEARLASARQAADRLTPALLAKAFRGELVPQDPNDEPASELLKRLAAQRETTTKPKRTKKTTSL